MSSGKEEARELNEFHVKVALHHLRAIVADLVPRHSVQLYTLALKGAEQLEMSMKETP